MMTRGLQFLQISGGSHTRGGGTLFFQQPSKWDLRRVGAACIAALQIGASAALGPADAILDIERFGSPVHVESPENADCAVDHGHLFCQVVRSLSKAGVSGGITLPQVCLPPLRLPEPDRVADRLPIAPILCGSIVPRAPPIV